MSELERESTNQLTNLFKDFGMDALSTKILATLYFEPKEITMEEIAKKTNYSLASISNKLRNLELFIEKSKKLGSKKTYYYMEKNLFRINMRKIRIGQEKMQYLEEGMKTIIDKYKKQKLSEKDKEVLKLIENYHTQIVMFEKVMEKFGEYLQKCMSEQQ